MHRKLSRTRALETILDEKNDGRERVDVTDIFLGLAMLLRRFTTLAKQFLHHLLFGFERGA